MTRSDRPDYGALLREGYRTIERLEKKLERLERAKSEPIAIVGMACRLPGGANDPEAYWEILRNGVDAIAEIPPSRWDVSRYYDADPTALGKMSTRWGGFIDDVDLFDTHLFGISPREAASMDPQQRILLEVAWEALERAGIAPDSLMGSRTGVFVGISTSDYSHIQTTTGGAETYDAYLATGNSHSLASGRLAYVFGLQGPTFSIDTACSSSLIAVHTACQALRAGQGRAALAGGVNLILIPEASVTLSKAQMMAADGRCKTFSAEADGFVRGEGCGVVVLKRLSDAKADGDRILAVLRGSAINQDGRSNGLTAPNGLAQAALIAQALADARVKPAEVGYVEAHGTGTPLGDPIEVQALADALSAGRTADNRLKIGSAKTNIGHTEAAAGFAGLLKVVLALQHREIPPHLHLRSPNPHIAWDQIPIDVPTVLTPWESAGPRIAGVSSFGFSGSNAHVIVEEAPPEAPLEDAGPARPLHLLALSARTAPALENLASRYVQHFERHPDASLADVCFTAGVGRAHLSNRLALTAATVEEARAKLVAYVADPAATGLLRGENRRSERPEVAFLFTGQGAQHAQMGRQLYETQPTFRRTIERCADLLREQLERPLIDVLYPAAGGEGLIHETAYSQPALFAVEYALAELWRSWGIEPGVVAGHSVGEYVAACVAGAMSLESALMLVAARGRLMQALPHGGAMLAVGTGAASVEAFLATLGGHARVSLAALNAPNATVISGDAAAVEQVRAHFEAEGVRAQPLVVSHAFHSHLMEPMLEPFEAIARSVAYETPQIAWVSTVTGEWLRAVDGAYWRRQVRQPVRFAQAVRTLRARGIELAVEMGPSPVLLGLARQCEVDAPGWVGSLRKGRSDWGEILNALGTLYVHGATVNWAGVDRDYQRRRVEAPTYPFARERYWCATRESTGLTPEAVPADTARVVHPLLGARLRSPLPEIQFENAIGRGGPSYLADHVVFGRAIVPASVYAALALAAAGVAMPSRSHALANVALNEPLVFPGEGSRAVQTVLSPPAEDRSAFRILSRAADSDEWTLHASGTIRHDADGRGPGSGDASGKANVEFETVRRACGEELPVAAYYDRLRGQGLEYGDTFRGLRELWRGERQALARVDLASELHEGAASFDLHPVLLDSCIQVLGAALSLDTSVDQVSQTYLKMGFDSLQTWVAGATELWSHASIREAAAGAETLVADIALFDTAGRLVGLLTGLLLKRASVSALRRAAQPRAGADWFYEERWEPMSISEATRASGGPSGVESSAPCRGAWLVLAFDEGPGAAAARELRARGESVVVVRPGQEYLRPGNGGSGLWTIDAAAPGDYVRLLGDVTRDGPCAGAVHAWAAAAEPATQTTTDRSNGLPEPDVFACRSALYLAQAAVARDDSPTLWFVTRGAQAASDVASDVNLPQALLAGFARSLALEQPLLGARRVDLDPQAQPDGNAKLLVDELLSSGGRDEIAFRDGRRLVRRLGQASVPAHAAPEMPAIHPDATYLVTGGFGGLGLIVARWLVERGARHLVLIGRSGATGAAAEAVADLQRQGVNVRVAQSSVADEAQMQALIGDISATMPPLRGIVHAAGVLEDGLIGRLDWDAFERVLAPKVDGARILHRLTQGLALDFFVLFSSVASLFGSPGQSNYAAANASLDALARHRRALGQPALSVNWGPWEDVGMAASVDAAHQQRWSRAGAAALTAESGMAALERAFAQPSGQIAIAPVDWSKVRSAGGAFASDPFVSHLLPQTGGAPPAARPAALPRSKLLAMSGEERDAAVTDYLRGVVAAVLGLAPAALDGDEKSTHMGVDSLMAMELKNRLEAGLGVAFPMARLLDVWTLNSLAALVLELIGGGPSGTHVEALTVTASIQEGEI